MLWKRTAGATLAILCAGATLLAAPSAVSANARPTGYAGPAHNVVRQVSPNVSSNATQQFTSRNWDGYITVPSPVKTDFNFIKATWVQPKVTCNAAQAWTVFWVGIDGWYDGTVEQGGSSAYCAKKGGTPEYDLWWEMFPTNSIQITKTAHAGDKITASVTYTPSTKVFKIVVQDLTSHVSFTKNEKCSSSTTCNRSSTDTITEDVGRFGSGNYFPLANYGTMGYTGINVKDVAGHSGSISATAWKNGAVTEKSGGITYATVSPLSAGGTAFKTTWKHV